MHIYRFESGIQAQLQWIHGYVSFVVPATEKLQHDALDVVRSANQTGKLALFNYGTVFKKSKIISIEMIESHPITVCASFEKKAVNYDWVLMSDVTEFVGGSRKTNQGTPITIAA